MVGIPGSLVHPESAAPPRHRARVIVLGNEKGGSGKSTAAMHLIVGLLRAGYAVGSLDVDARQATLTRYFENRAALAKSRGVRLPMPTHRAVRRSTLRGVAADDDERVRFVVVFGELAATNDVVVIDTPGSDSYLSRLAHSHADTLVTPLNDSFVDLDLLAKVDAETLRIAGPSLYSEMVWEQKKRRAMRDGESIDWLVMRNRLGSLDARNKRAVGEVLGRLAKRIGFRLAPGFCDRVIFREMFLSGLTLLDLREPGLGTPLNMSHLAARQEVRELLAAVGMHADTAAAAVAASGHG
ncbi:MAG: ATPase [Rhodospirillales bacterium]|nr:ATPase [Rhodospirillales bacterium]